MGENDSTVTRAARCAQQGRAGDTPAELAAHEVGNAMTAELLDE